MLIVLSGGIAKIVFALVDSEIEDLVCTLADSLGGYVL